MNEVLLREDSDGICTLTLNRPEKLNALDTAVFQRLDAECSALESEQDAIGCVVLRGRGRAFSSGADLTPASTTPPVPPLFKPRVIERLSILPQPLIASVHGACVTGGLELALAADIIVAGGSARFADTHGRWGLVAGQGCCREGVAGCRCGRVPGGGAGRCRCGCRWGCARRSRA